MHQAKDIIPTCQFGKAWAERGPVSEFAGTFKKYKCVTYALLLAKSLPFLSLRPTPFKRAGMFILKKHPK